MNLKNPFRQMAIDRIPSFHHEHPTYRWWVLGNVLITTFMAVIEATIVNTALPKMQNSFGTSLDTIEWVLTAFNLVFAVVLPLSGWLSEKLGYKRTFMLALVLFTGGSFLCSLAWNEDVLIFFRVIQGIGAGLIQPVGTSIVTREFPPQQRAVAFGFYGIAAAASLSLGPSLGGYLTDNFGWSSIFLVNVPFGILSMVATLLIQREYRNPKIGPFDMTGFIMITIFLLSLLLGLADGNAAWNTGGWTSPFILSCFAVAAGSLVLFFVVEARTDHPIIDLKMFLNRNFGLASILLFCIGLILLGSTFLTPVYLQGSLGYTALQSGLIFLPLGVIQAMVSPITGILNQRVDARIPALLGLFFLALSFYLNTFLSIDPPYWLLLLPICVRGIGFGLIFITVQSVAIASMPRDKISQGSGLINLSRQVGASFGVALIGLILSQRNIFHTAVSGEGVNTWSETFRNAAAQLHYAITSDGGQTGANATALTQMMIVRDASTKAFIESVNDSFILVTLMIAVLVIPVLFWKFPKKTAPGVEHGQAKPAESHAVAME